MNKPEAVEILEVRDESKFAKTIKLKKKLEAEPGQFVMLWIPRVGEKPFSMSRLDGDGIEITFDVKGPFTKALAKMKRGDLVGVRGPYGRGWMLGGAGGKSGEDDYKNVCIVAGGLGLAPLMPVIESNAGGGQGKKITVVNGVATKVKLIFQKRLEKAKVEALFTTDDGSFGKHCYACDLLGEMIRSKKFDLVLTCGPEIMMKKVVDYCEEAKVPCQVSMERYMKCGVGVCGSCALDPDGLCVCKDGPVFWSKEVNKPGGDFGRHFRDKSGEKNERGA